MKTLISPQRISMSLLEERREATFGELMPSLDEHLLSDRNRLFRTTGIRFWRDELENSYLDVDDAASLRIITLNSEAIQVVSDIMDAAAVLKPTLLHCSDE